tara:strand:- start:386 stop:1261 length:876 start_codon:yes stop_codon:yes gene_type:complete
MDFMRKMQEFADKAVQLHKDLTNRSDDLPKGRFEPPTGRLTSAFRFVPDNPIDNIYDKISISTPMDSGCIETALFKNGHMIDYDLLGYGNSIRRWGTINDLIKELNRLDGTITESQKDKVNGEEEETSESESESESEEEEEEEEEVKSSKEEFAVQSEKLIHTYMNQKIELLFSFKKEQEAKNLEIQSLKEELELLKDSVDDSTKELKEELELLKDSVNDSTKKLTDAFSIVNDSTKKLKDSFSIVSDSTKDLKLLKDSVNNSIKKLKDAFSIVSSSTTKLEELLNKVEGV